jgi:raffinose/stachyose/melibiose transport system permease protein
MIVSPYEKWISRILLVLMMLITIGPFVSLLLTALHAPGTEPGGMSIPPVPHWGNFIEAFRQANMGVLMLSSSLIVIGVVPISLLVSTLAGFSLGHLRPPGSKAIFIVFLLGLTLPFQAIIVPLYFQIRDMGLLETRWAIILPLIGLFMPFSVMWMRAHFLKMPEELSEAARIDGATTWQLFWKVHVPLSMPALSSLGILLFLWTWNHFVLSMLMVTNPVHRTVAGALGHFQGQWGRDVPLMMAGSILILLPTLIVFLVFQKRFVAALMQGALKG